MLARAKKPKVQEEMDENTIELIAKPLFLPNFHLNTSKLH